MGKEKLSSLIKEELKPESTVLVHGTSIEATLAFFESGKLTTSQYSRRYHYKGYMFFVPNGIHFRAHPLGRNFDKTAWADVLDHAIAYAEQNAYLHSIPAQLGFNPDTLPDLTDFSQREVDRQIDNLLLEIWRRSLQSGQRRVTRTELMEILGNARQRKGVLFGISRDVFNLEIEEGKDEPDGEVCIYLPEGLEKKYIS